MASHLGLKLPLSAPDLQEYSERARNAAFINGLVVGRRSDPMNMGIRSHITLTLLPTPIPKTVFEDLREFQTEYTELYHELAHDFDFLETHLKPVAEVDDFVGKLWEIHEEVKNQPKNQHKCLCLARNDFMLDDLDTKLVPKQIEINTIASSFGGLGTRLREYHGHILRIMGCGDVTDRIPVSHLDENFAEAMINAHQLYGNKKAVILFVIEESNVNVCDQRFIEHAIYRQNPEMKVIFRTFAQIDKTITLGSGSRKMTIEGFEVAVVYFRTGYAPHLSNGEVPWKVRIMIEKSDALKAPCIHTHLVGCKKIQQVLCQPGMVERYVKNKRTAARIRATFAGQYTMDQTPEGDYAASLAMANPQKYVLKTQREGGGNNIYGIDIVKELESLKNSDERGKYVLMERIFPPEYENYLLVAEGDTKYGRTVSELGLYVSSLWNGGEMKSKYCGQFLRTKMHDDDEGGVSVGIAAIDSLLLF